MKKPRKPESHLTSSDATSNRYADGLPAITVRFTDEFSPSHFEYSSPSGDEFEGPLVRHFVYNTQIFDTLYEATVVANKLGFPDVGVSPGQRFIPVSTEMFRQISQIGHQVCQKLTEASFEWLCVQCYLRWIAACWRFTEPLKLPEAALSASGSQDKFHSEAEMQFHQRSLDAMTYGNDLLCLGAACRELELSLINKKVATARRKQIRAFAHMNKGRAQANTDRAAQAAIWRSLACDLATKSSLNGMARARWVSVNLLSKHKIQKSPKTVWAAISKI